MTSMSNLALVLQNRRRFEEAETMHRQVLEKRTEVLGDKHPDTIMSMNNLAFVLKDQQRFEEAVTINQRVLEIRIEILGDRHPDTLTSMHEVALDLRDIGEVDNAEVLTRKVLEFREEVLGLDNPATLKTVWCLASLLDLQCKGTEALVQWERACSGFRATLGEDHQDFVKCSEHYAAFLTRTAS